MTKFLLAIISAAFVGIGSAALAVPVSLGNSIKCSAGNAQNGIAIGDVTGNAGGATNCWGTLDGNDPGPSGDGFDIDGMTYDFISKLDTPGGPDGTDIGLAVSGGGTTSGTWSFTGLPGGYGDFLIVLKAASKPGFAIWLFEGPHAASTSGNWLVAWNKGLSHLSVYAKESPISPPAPIPVPAAGFLLVGALAGLAGLRRRNRGLRRSS